MAGMSVSRFERTDLEEGPGRGGRGQDDGRLDCAMIRLAVLESN